MDTPKLFQLGSSCFIYINNVFSISFISLSKSFVPHCKRKIIAVKNKERLRKVGIMKKTQASKGHRSAVQYQNALLYH